MKKIIVITILLIGVNIIFSTNKEQNKKILLTGENIDNIAFYIQDGENSSNYKNTDTIPAKNGGYIFKEAICDDEANVTFDHSQWAIIVSNLSKNSTKCKLYFDINKDYAKEYILSHISVNETTPTLNKTATTNEGVFKAEDDDGTSYYYRGAVTNNYVKFAGIYWRIIRINGDGSIRLIYQGTTPTSNGQTESASYNTNYNDNAYIGYMFGTIGSSTYEATHTNTNSSTIKTNLEYWYRNTLLSYASYIDYDAGFCNDRQKNTTSETWWANDTKLGYGKNTTTYAPYGRQFLNGNWRTVISATLKCTRTNDYFTSTNSVKGNKKLTYPIGLITSDEVVLAGGYIHYSNTNYYLYTGQSFWTMSPFDYDKDYSSAGMLIISNTGAFAWGWVQNSNGIRPVINLKKNVILSGSGTSTDPYLVS